jgi:hypothetical protein
MQIRLVALAALLGLPALADEVELTRVDGKWADGSDYTAILSRTDPDAMVGILIYDPASAEGEAGGDPLVANAGVSPHSDEVSAEARPDGTLVVTARATYADIGTTMTEVLTIGQWDGEIAVRHYQMFFGDPAAPEADPNLFCDANVIEGRITWPSPDLQRDPGLPMPTAAEMRLRDWTSSLAAGLDPGLGLCIAYN